MFETNNIGPGPSFPETLSLTPANDNIDWVTDLFVAMRVFTELHRRYRKLDPRRLTRLQMVNRAKILSVSVTSILRCWKELAGS